MDFLTSRLFKVYFYPLVSFNMCLSVELFPFWVTINPLAGLINWYLLIVELKSQTSRTLSTSLYSFLFFFSFGLSE